jgi:hypothetical protein
MEYKFNQNIILQNLEINKIPEFPVYDGKEHPNDYLLRLDEYKKKANKERCEQILYFINIWLKKDFKCLYNIKNISEKIFPNEDENAKFVKECSTKIMNLFCIKYEFNKKKVISSDIIKFLNIALKKIDYHIYKKKYDNNTVYTIKYDGN